MPRRAAQAAGLSRSQELEAAAEQARPALPARPAPPRPSRSHPRRRQRGDPATVLPGPPRVLRAGGGAVTPGIASHGGAAGLRLQLPRPGNPFPAPGPEAAGRERRGAVTVVSNDGRNPAAAAPRCRCPALAAGDDALPGRGPVTRQAHRQWRRDRQEQHGGPGAGRDGGVRLGSGPSLAHRGCVSVSLQGKQKKARKYAVMKRMISLRDERL